MSNDPVLAKGDAPPTPRDAASLVLIRRDGDAPRVLMGQRGAKARFMPSKFVFPGGALDPADDALGPCAALDPRCARRLAADAPPDIARRLGLAAIRETFEETGLALGAADETAIARAGDSPESWARFLRRGVRPALDRLEFLFRAITPPTRPVRFDARFFLAFAEDVQGDLDDFSEAEDELSHLGWLTLEETRSLDLPFITTVVLAEAQERLDRPDPARPVPYFRHDGERSFMESLA